jgi:dTDP-4-dehydrorhamnose reductase
VHLSTNEVFSGGRTHDRGYLPDDPPAPGNPYGASKLAGEAAATAAYARGGVRLAIVRTAWLYGPPGNDFPTKILAAAEGAAARGEPLKVVGDEFGSPTFANDLAEAIADLIGSGDIRGIHHITDTGVASRADWARELFRQLGVDVGVEDIPASAWPRASTPPAWGVLEPTMLPSGGSMRPWQQALADYVPTLRRRRAAATR